MIRRGVLGLACLLASVTSVFAGPVDRVLNDLSRLGYGRVTVERTLLGRTRILASNDGAEREIIMDSRTGEILRDLWVSGAPDRPGGGLVGGGSSSGNDDDDADDDDDDGGNRGPGGSGGGGDDDGGDDDDGGEGGGGGDDGGDDGGGNDGSGDD